MLCLTNIWNYLNGLTALLALPKPHLEFMKTRSNSNYKKFNALWTAMTVFFYPVLQGYLWSNESKFPVEMIVQKNGCFLEVSILADNIINEVEPRFYSLRVESLARELTQFYLSKRLPLVFPKIKHRFELLSDQWSGRVELYADLNGKEQKIAEYEVKPTSFSGALSRFRGPESTNALLQALRKSVAFTLRCQKKNPHSPGFEGLNLFYDLDARTDRTSYWMWAWGPSVRLLLDVSERPEFSAKRDNLFIIAGQTGDSTLCFLWQEPGNPLDQIMLSRRDRGSNVPEGFLGAITFADSLFLAGWAWIPLYEKLGNERYLDLTRQLVQSSNKLMGDFKVLPHSYYVDIENWSDFTLDESGFGMEGYAEAYRATQNESYRQWFDISCVYTSAFYGLAIMKELKLQSLKI